MKIATQKAQCIDLLITRETIYDRMVLLSGCSVGAQKTKSKMKSPLAQLKNPVLSVTQKTLHNIHARIVTYM